MKHKITGTIKKVDFDVYEINLFVEDVENFDLEELLRQEAKSKQIDGAV